MFEIIVNYDSQCEVTYEIKYENVTKLICTNETAEACEKLNEPECKTECRIEYVDEIQYQMVEKCDNITEEVCRNITKEDCKNETVTVWQPERNETVCQHQEQELCVTTFEDQNVTVIEEVCWEEEVTDAITVYETVCKNSTLMTCTDDSVEEACMIEYVDRYKNVTVTKCEDRTVQQCHISTEPQCMPLPICVQKIDLEYVPQTECLRYKPEKGCDIDGFGSNIRNCLLVFELVTKDNCWTTYKQVPKHRMECDNSREYCWDEPLEVCEDYVTEVCYDVVEEITYMGPVETCGNKTMSGECTNEVIEDCTEVPYEKNVTKLVEKCDQIEVNKTIPVPVTSCQNKTVDVCEITSVIPGQWVDKVEEACQDVIVGVDCNEEEVENCYVDWVPATIRVPKEICEETCEEVEDEDCNDSVTEVCKEETVTMEIKVPVESCELQRQLDK